MRMPLVEGSVYKYAYSCWDKVCELASACLCAHVSVCGGGINKGTIHIRASIEEEQRALWVNLEACKIQ